MSATADVAATKRRQFHEEFLSVLLVDAIASLKRYELPDADEQRSRRELLRTLFAAVEGFAWAYREHVRFAAKSIDMLSVAEELALSEVTYQVSEYGKVTAQPRFISIIATIRLASKIAMRLSPDLEIRFDTSDWNRFRLAIAMRNRLTHPKRAADLVVGDADVADCISAFFWLVDIASDGMEAANAAMSKYLGEFRSILDGLKTGNPDVLAAYTQAIEFLAD